MDNLKQLKRDIEQWENQYVEFKKSPSKHDLAQTIAGFATANAGRIYIGVSSDRKITGVDGVKTGIGKDRRQRQISRTTRDNVRPPIHVKVLFIEDESGKTVIRIDVPKGKEPVYYADYRPYTRSLSDTRKLDPSEVRNLHRQHFSIFESAEPPTVFRTIFTSRLDDCVRLIKEKSLENIEDLIDELIMLIKERIEKWDVPSVRFSTKELFLKLYKLSGNGLCDLYTIYEDLFSYAYSQRRHMLGSMIGVFNLLLFGSWVPEYNVERGEKAAQVMLRLGTAFLERDLAVSKDCLGAIDNLAGDMFEPEILSKEILFGAIAFQKMKKNPELKDFVENTIDWIKVNDQYAWGDGKKTYLRDSILYVDYEKEREAIDSKSYRRYVDRLLEALEENINQDIQSYIDFLNEFQSEGDEDVTFPAQSLAQTILAYEFLRPNIASEIKEQVFKAENQHLTKIFKRIVKSNNFLRKIYEGSDMITTFKELIEFFRNNSAMEDVDTGIETWGLTFVNFVRKLKEGEKQALEKFAQKYELKETIEFELTDQTMTFMADYLVMEKLVGFLSEINNVVEIKSLSISVDFKLRKTGTIPFENRK